MTAVIVGIMIGGPSWCVLALAVALACGLLLFVGGMPVTDYSLSAGFLSVGCLVAPVLGAWCSAELVTHLLQARAGLRSVRAAAPLAALGVMLHSPGLADALAATNHILREGEKSGIIAAWSGHFGAGVAAVTVVTIAVVGVSLALECAAQWSVRRSLRVVEIPWPALRILGALLVVAIALQYLAAILNGSLDPAHFAEQMHG